MGPAATSNASAGRIEAITLIMATSPKTMMFFMALFLPAICKMALRAYPLVADFRKFALRFRDPRITQT
jgi:hypothetical protein